MKKTADNTAEIFRLLHQVKDPEIPVLSVVDMGVVRHIEIRDGGIMVTITPTYSGCPAMNTIAKDIEAFLSGQGFSPVTIKTVLSPIWTTDWITENGRKALKNYGIAPPSEESLDKKNIMLEEVVVKCPRCESQNTQMTSEFGSTACKALYKCLDCLEPFDYFKCI